MRDRVNRPRASNDKEQIFEAWQVSSTPGINFQARII